MRRLDTKGYHMSCYNSPNCLLVVLLTKFLNSVHFMEVTETVDPIAMILLPCFPSNKMGSLRSYWESWMVCTINCLLVLAELKESMEK